MRMRFIGSKWGSQLPSQGARRPATIGVVALGVALWMGGVGVPSMLAAAPRQDAVVASFGDSARTVWTEEMIAAARPMPGAEFDLEAAVAFHEQMMREASNEAGAAEARKAAGPVSAPGRGPDPALVEFFRQAEAERGPEINARSLSPLSKVTQEASGSSKGYFTSQYLVPPSADLTYPYTTVGRLVFFLPGFGSTYCSAAVLRSRIVVTAANCVHGGKNVGFYSDFVFTPAFRNGAAPFGAWQGVYGVVPTAWATSTGKVPHASDFAFIEVEDIFINGAVRRLGDVVGTLGYSVSKLFPNHATTLGYPFNFSNQLMRQCSSESLKKGPASTVQYGCDFGAGGQGAPMIQDFGTLEDPAALTLWVGTVSFFGTGAQKIVSASIPTTANFVPVLNTACNHRSGNC